MSSTPCWLPLKQTAETKECMKLTYQRQPISPLSFIEFSIVHYDWWLLSKSQSEKRLYKCLVPEIYRDARAWFWGTSVYICSTTELRFPSESQPLPETNHTYIMQMEIEIDSLCFIQLNASAFFFSLLPWTIITLMEVCLYDLCPLLLKRALIYCTHLCNFMFLLQRYSTLLEWFFDLIN